MALPESIWNRWRVPGKAEKVRDPFRGPAWEL